MSDDESFARLIYIATVCLRRSEPESWLMPIGHLLDQREIYWQMNGLAKPKREYFIDDILPDYL